MRYTTNVRLPKLRASFYRSGFGRALVRDWLLTLSREECRQIGKDIARVLFAVSGQEIVLLHGFIKKTQRTPVDEIRLAEKRWKEWQHGKAQ